MADAIIEIVGQDDLPTIVELYNQIVRPAREAAAFRRRFLGRYHPLQMMARVSEKPVGFFLGYEQEPGIFCAWLFGVLPEHRRQGIASQLMEAVHDWTAIRHYERIRLECHNSRRAMLHLSIRGGYDVTGVRWDGDRGDLLVVLEKELQRQESGDASG